MRKILVIDDSKSWREYLKDNLTKMGYDVSVAENGFEGINLFFKILPDVVISDYIMPQMNGIHFCRFIRSYDAFSRVGIIILTGAEDSINEFWAKKSGADLFIKKDKSPENILESIVKFLESNKFTIEWSREFYKFRKNPFSELVDILEETLKIEIIKSSILDLISNIYDEEYIMIKLKDLLKEFFKFENLNIMILSHVIGRVYAFSNNKKFQCKKIKKLLYEKLLNPTTPSEWIFKGDFCDKGKNETILLENSIFFNLKSGNTDLGVISFSNFENKNTIAYYMNFMLEPLTTLFKALNNYMDYKVSSERDSLTGLYNKRKITEKLRELIILFKRKKYGLSVAILDIDGFKQINDEFGHITGDKVLIKLSQIMQDELRENDFIGRFGGEEFLILLPETECIKAKKVLERLLKKVSEYNWEKLGINKKITFSAGVFCDYKKRNVTYIINKADELMYMAKKLGKNRIISKEDLL
ncbi:diguanylate cyclase [Marinitoga sp. 1197]|uniref:GGDEF domain-containing response regulator n=1 Tax=Marinitoga sp. 1197 TaxID=1428449 RepID=UPI0006414802|nr:diguanylate cyclase [Marinitoga sp. 1197]KLO23327.1 diguanylate cyclase [Marinitoga sp. 1197]